MFRIRNKQIKMLQPAQTVLYDASRTKKIELPENVASETFKDELRESVFSSKPRGTFCLAQLQPSTIDVPLSGDRSMCAS
jgi:hypothetical protein